LSDTASPRAFPDLTIDQVRSANVKAASAIRNHDTAGSPSASRRGDRMTMPATGPTQKFQPTSASAACGRQAEMVRLRNAAR
jgi:hypothetical protein